MTELLQVLVVTVDTQKIKGSKQPVQKLINSQREAEKREEERNKETTKKPESNKMKLVNSYLSIITLNVNGLNSPVKRHRVDE